MHRNLTCISEKTVVKELFLVIYNAGFEDAQPLSCHHKSRELSGSNAP